VDREKVYSLDEAVALLKAVGTARFDETVEVAVQLGVDPKQSDQQVRGSVSLPSGIGKSLRVAVFVEGQQADEARAAGAEHVGGSELIERVEGGWADFDVALATPEMMRQLGRIGRHLGPKGLMPSPKNGTVRSDIGAAVREFKAGKVEVRNDSGGNVHVPVGKLSFSNEAIVANIRELLDYVVRLRPQSAKGKYLESVVVSSTMGPGVKVAV
jgi:large subunit ribosomal protein L1